MFIGAAVVAARRQRRCRPPEEEKQEAAEGETAHADGTGLGRKGSLPRRRRDRKVPDVVTSGKTTHCCPYSKPWYWGETELHAFQTQANQALVLPLSLPRIVPSIRVPQAFV